jgi:hypothetical protein
MLRGETCYFVTDVSGQPIGPISKSEAVPEQVALPHGCVKLYFSDGTAASYYVH